MLCPQCFGKGFITETFPRLTIYVSHICPVCLGFGIIHCCDGEQEQEQPDDKTG